MEVIGVWEQSSFSVVHQNVYLLSISMYQKQLLPVGTMTFGENVCLKSFTKSSDVT